MEMDMPINTLDAGDPGQIAQFIGVRGIYHIRRSAILYAELVGELAAQIGGVLNAVGAPVRMVQKDRADAVDAAFHGHQAAAPSHTGVHVRKIDVVLFEQFHDGVAAVLELIGERLIGLEDFGVVLHCFGEEAFIPLEKPDLCAGGAGVDGKDLIFFLFFHLTSPPVHERSSSQRCPRSRKQARLWNNRKRFL